MQKQQTLAFISISLSLILMMATPSFAGTPYTVAGGKVLDSNSYQGYKVFRQSCARCHGTYGQGGPKAPDLSESLATLSQQEFTDTVTSGNVKSSRKLTKSGRMPAWKRNSKVMKNMDNIYSYLKARSDGAIGAVRPKLGK